MVHFKNNPLGVFLVFISHSTNEETEAHRDELANNKFEISWLLAGDCFFHNFLANN